MLMLALFIKVGNVSANVQLGQEALHRQKGVDVVIGLRSRVSCWLNEEGLFHVHDVWTRWCSLPVLVHNVSCTISMEVLMMYCCAAHR